ncbi:MAG: hypothetical protein ACKERF_00970 [Candidatus Hodgkinia cicadicola]
MNDANAQCKDGKLRWTSAEAASQKWKSSLRSKLRREVACGVEV